MLRRSLVTVILLACTTAVQAQSAGAVHQALVSESVRLQAFGTDRSIIDFVKAQNAKHVPLADIQRLDKEWMAGGAAAMVKAVTTGACADYLKKLFAEQDKYAEVFLMDNQGALVCANDKTTDYWQGDEDKWIRSFNKGKGTTFIDRPRYDESSKSDMATISVPVFDGGSTVGVLMIGVRVNKLTVARK